MVQLRVTRVLALMFAAHGPALVSAHQGATGSLQQLRDEGHMALDIDAEGSVRPAGTTRESEAPKASSPTRRLTVTSAPLNAFGHSGDAALERKEPVANAFGSDVGADVMLKVGAAGDVAHVRPTQIRRVTSNPTSGSAPVADKLARRLSIEKTPWNSFGHSGDSEHLINQESPGSVQEGVVDEVRPAGIVRGSEGPAVGGSGSTAQVKTRPRSLVIQTAPLDSFGHGGEHEAKIEAPHHYARTADDESKTRNQGLMIAAAGLSALALTGAYHARAGHEKEPVEVQADRGS